jgi:spore germination protein YaaH
MSRLCVRGFVTLMLAGASLGTVGSPALGAPAEGTLAGGAPADGSPVGGVRVASAPAVNSLSFSVQANSLSFSAGLASTCMSRAPHGARMTRLGGSRVRLRWKAPSGEAPLAYRVLRAKQTVGQTRRTSMIVRVAPGKRTAFTIQARYALAPKACSETLRGGLVFRAPGRVQKLRVLAHNAVGVRIGWSPARRGDDPLAGYRIERDGAIAGQTHGRSFILRLSGGRVHRVTVTAVDTAGHLGPTSKALTIGALHSAVAVGGGAPSTPGSVSASDLGDEAATIWWLQSLPGGARIVGYRVYRDDQLVGQTTGTSMRLTHLSSLHTYGITVGAVDADKRESARTPPFGLTTTHTPPDGPALLSAEDVTDTSATLSWQGGSANSGNLVGYVLFEDGAPEGLVHGQTATVALASQRSYVFTVRALDSAGYLSAPAPNLTVLTTHTPPSTPSGLAAGEVTDHSAVLGWSPSTPVSGEVIGYRVFRDGIPVGQTATLGMTLESLAPSTAYQVTVVAVDSLGAISAPTAPLEVQTAPPVQTHGHVQAFLLASTDESFHDLEAHYQQIGVVYPTYFDCGVNGAVTGVDDPLVTGWAEARGIAVMPRLNCQNPTDENQILNEPAAGQAMIDQLASLCATYGYQGIQIDFEGAQPAERNPFTAFITALATRLHSQGDKLSTIVTAKYYNIMSGRAAMYDDAALSGPSDYVFVLDWGKHWTTSGPGGMDELPWFKSVAEYTATLPNKSKFVLGMPMYGIDWPNGGGPSNPGTPLEFNNITALQSEFGVTGEWEPVAADPHFSYVDGNGVPHSVWYSDKQSIEVRVALAESLGLGVGLWHLGSEDQSIWELPGLGGEG